MVTVIFILCVTLVRVSLVEMGQNSFHFNRKQKSELDMIKQPMAEIDRIRPQFALSVQ